MKESDWDENIVLDDQHLATFTGGDPGFETQILNIFLENAPEYLKALQGTDVSDWKATAHKLKGAARSIGAWNLAREAERAEHMGAPAPQDPSRISIIAELETRLESLVTHIQSR